jgi:uncharacterized membrane protein
VASTNKDTVLVQVYRGEVSRSDTWRTRLDQTTNWALTVAAFVASLAFASPTASHVMLIVGFFLVTTFLVVEARRYRYYDLWIRRVRLFEDGYVASTLRGETPDDEAMRELADLYARPRLHVGFWDAIGLRLRRTYAPIYLVLFVGWFAKILVQPTPVGSVAEFILRAHLGIVPGALMIALATAAFVTGATLWLRAFVKPLPLGELRPRQRPRRALSAVFLSRSTTRPAASTPPF